MKKLTQSVNKIRVHTGQTILQQGRHNEVFYIIRAGSVGVWAETPRGLTHLATLEEGEFFGEVSILTGRVCNATVIADCEVELFTLPASLLREAVKENTSFSDQLTAMLSKRTGVKALGFEPLAALHQKSFLERTKSFFRFTS